ncbi:MAG: hypothetical protein SAL07_15585 [Oscillatoria sp. PMC 1051.18]|uniref:hypothetical protein n=1 Tax=Oscillatoria salina TaxID=331517 RepID=UPI001CCF440A|nr:hypothetical protein [Oscillatoria salina]MBZ8178665.1 hypothetical protein [Oscillatoria salina IIICB1]MEC4893613.1 hypothetical protein [Oscillatoria sp. PMC 1050.18]MEC5031320.1 hypothetical protein [Oscillatoria sp. PMC 1051.18]
MNKKLSLAAIASAMTVGVLLGVTSNAQPCSFSKYKQAESQPTIPNWVGFMAMGAIGSSIIVNEMTKNSL